MKRKPLPPEEFDRVEKGLEHLLFTVTWAHHTLDSEPTAFEREFLQAGWNRDPIFFQMLADVCEIRTKQWIENISETSLVTFLARQVKARLLSNGQSLTRPNIRKLVKDEWAALKIGWNPMETEFGKIAGGSRTHYDIFLKSALAGEDGDRLRKILSKRTDRFPESVWRDVWKDPALREVKLGKPGRPRK